LAAGNLLKNGKRLGALSLIRQLFSSSETLFKQLCSEHF
jgi:hypothetical protein